MLRFTLAALIAVSLSAQTPIMPLSQIRAGMRGIGRTIFQGNKVEEFQAEILGVMENTGPKQSMILARLSGGPLATTGVMQGMSGSPVYIDGRLIGAVATAFSFSKEPITGIRPIEDMLALPGPVAGPRAMRWAPDGSHMAEALLAALPASLDGNSKLTNIATPVSFTGFPSTTIDRFAPQFRALGMEPRQGVSGGGGGSTALGDTKLVTPGSMISAHLISGDFVMGADGTVTHVDGNAVYAFGHQFLKAGSVEVPFWRSEVLALLPSTEISFKISSSREFMGTLTGDYESGIRGVLGRQPSLLPVRITVNGRQTYNLSVVRDDLLSPFFLQVATAAAMDAKGRAAGEGTARIDGEIRFAAGTPVRIHNTYSADTALSGIASLAGAIPLSYVLQSGFSELMPVSVQLDIQTTERKNQLTVDDLWASRAKVRPGETVEFSIELRGDGGREVVRRISYQVPLGMPAGPLQISVHDAQTANVLDYAQTVNQPPHSATQAVEFLNGLRPNSQAFLRIVRPEASFPVGTRQLADPPPSVALLLNRWPASASPALPQARVAEFPVDGGTDAAQVSGTRTIQIEVVE